MQLKYNLPPEQGRNTVKIPNFPAGQFVRKQIRTPGFLPNRVHASHHRRSPLPLYCPLRTAGVQSTAEGTRCRTLTPAPWPLLKMERTGKTGDGSGALESYAWPRLIFGSLPYQAVGNAGVHGSKGAHSSPRRSEPQPWAPWLPPHECWPDPAAEGAPRVERGVSWRTRVLRTAHGTRTPSLRSRWQAFF